jgi:shikimate dehydrogenase
MTSLTDIAAIQRCVSNRIDAAALGERALAGVIGDTPSHYSKSPRVWNAAFERLGMGAVYLPFDVEDGCLGDLLNALKICDGFLGANVTVPHKVRVMDYLDSIDAGARRIQAVNTIVKTSKGKLLGFNTDGEGFIDSLLTPQPGRDETFIRDLHGINVLLIGAGGSARAVAFHLVEKMDSGKLLLCNRTVEPASSLAQEINKTGGDAIAIGESEILQWVPKVGLIVNSTTKGQGGVRRLASGKATLLEPYSALAAAQPPVFDAAAFDETDGEQRWFEAALSDIQANNQASIELAQSVPPHVGFYDLIYHPEETVFLRHGRLTGHRTMNGKAMIINQAAIAFCRHICNAELRSRNSDTAQTRNEILEVMYSAW